MTKSTHSSQNVADTTITAGQRPILVDIHFGRSAIVSTRPQAIKYGFREGNYYTEFYTLDIIGEPKWKKITENTTANNRAILPFLEVWVEEEKITSTEADWTRAQFDAF